MSSMEEMHCGKHRRHSFEQLIHSRHRSQEMVDCNDSCRTTGLILLLVLGPEATEHSKSFNEPSRDFIRKWKVLKTVKRA